MAKTDHLPVATNMPVLIVDGDEVLGEALVGMLRGEGFQARAFTDATKLLANLPDVPCACVISDADLSDMDGRRLLRRLLSEKSGAWPVVLMSAHANVPMAVELLKAGAADFIEKPVSVDTLAPVVKNCLDQAQAAAIGIAERRRVNLLIAKLSPRESHVYQAIINGCTTKSIARDLAISPRTVDIFRARVMAKMGVRNLAQLVRTELFADPFRPA